MWRILVALLFSSLAVAQEGKPILTDEGKPIKVIIGAKVVTPDTMPMLPNKPVTATETTVAPSAPEQLPPPRVLAIDPVAAPKRVGVVQYLLGETLAYVDERRSQVRPAAHKTLSGSEPGLLHESIRESKTPETTPVTPQEVHVTHSAMNAPQPTFTTAVMQQMVAILAAVIVLAVLTLAAYFFVLRKYVPFTSLFQVQVVGGMPGVPFIPAALAQAEQTSDPFADVTPNFELGPTYEEEMALKQAASERQELAVLSHIADLNANIQQELKDQGMLSDEPTERSALETLTQPEPAV